MIGLFLFHIAPSGCREGELRLVGGKNDKEGDVQLCQQGVWAYVHDYDWFSDEARVVCQELNYATSCETFESK